MDIHCFGGKTGLFGGIPTVGPTWLAILGVGDTEGDGGCNC